MRYSLALLIMVGIDLLSILFAMAGMIALGWGLWQLGLGFLWCALISMAIITGLWAIAEKVIDYRRSSRRLARGLVGLPEYLPASDNSNPQRPTDTELRRAAFWTAMGLSTVLFVLIVAMAALTSLGTTSPLYIMQQAMYFPCLGSHFAIIDAGSKLELVISATDSDS